MTVDKSKSDVDLGKCPHCGGRTVDDVMGNIGEGETVLSDESIWLLLSQKQSDQTCADFMHELIEEYDSEE